MENVHIDLWMERVKLEELWVLKLEYILGKSWVEVGWG